MFRNIHRSRLPFTPAPKIVAIGQVEEIDTPQAITANKARALGQNTETDTPQTTTRVYPYESYVIDTVRPQIYWRLNDTSGNPQDSSGNGNHATAISGATYSQTGLLYGNPDDSIDFSGGAGSGIAKSTSIPATPAGSYAVGVWAQPDDLAAARYLFAKDFGNNASIMYLYVETDGSVVAGHHNGITFATVIAPAGSVSADQIYLFGMDFDTSTKMFTLYINGAAAAGPTNFTNNVIANSGEITVGQNAAHTQNFDGFIDEYFYKNDGNLTSQQWADLYDLGTAEVQTISVAQATETDSVQAISAKKTKALGQNTETDLAQSFNRVQTITVNQVSETDSVQSVTSKKTKTLGQAISPGDAATLFSGDYVPALSGFSPTSFQNTGSTSVYVEVSGGIVADGNEGGLLVLEVCPDSGFGGNTHIVDGGGADNASGNAQLGIGQGYAAWIPPDHYYRIRKVTLSGTPTEVLDTGFELRMTLAEDVDAGTYSTNTFAGFETPRQNTSVDPIQLSAIASITCDPGEEGRLVLEVSADSSFNDVEEVSPMRFGVESGVAAAVTAYGGLKVIVQPGYYWRYRRTSTTGSPTFAIRDNNEVTIGLPGIVTSSHYIQQAYAGLNTARQNTTGSPILLSVGAGEASDPGENGHVYIQVSTDSDFLDPTDYSISYAALRNTAGQGDGLVWDATTQVLVPAGSYWRYFTTTAATYASPAWEILDGREFLLPLSNVTQAQPIQAVKGDVLGQATETDLAQPVVYPKRIPVGQVTETDEAQLVGKIDPTHVALTQATETDTSQSVTTSKVKALAQNTETDTAQSVTASKVKAIGQNSETDAVQSITSHKTKVVAQTSETDSAQSLLSRKQKAIEQNSESDSAQSITVIVPKFITVNQATETDTAQILTKIDPILAGVAQASETDAAQTLSAHKQKAITQTTESDTAQAISSSKVKAIAQASETDTTQTISSHKQKTIGQNTETDLAQIIVSPKRVLVAQAEETDTAQIMGKIDPIIAGTALATETDTSQTVSARKTQSIGINSETDSAQSISSHKTVSVNQVIETDSAQTITSAKNKAIGQNSETDIATPIAGIVPQIIPVEQVFETDTAQIVGKIDPILAGIAFASETDSAESISSYKQKAIGQNTETDTAQSVSSHKVKVLGQVVETDTLHSLTSYKQKAIGQNSETDVAQPVTVYILSPQIIPVNQVEEFDSVNGLTAIKIGSVNPASETDSAQSLNSKKNKAIGQTEETELAIIIGPGEIFPVYQNMESDIAQAISARKTKTITQSSETDSAQSITKHKTKAISESFETDSASSLTYDRAYQVGQALETDTSQPISIYFNKRITVSVISETDQSITITKYKQKSFNQVFEIDEAEIINRKTYFRPTFGRSEEFEASDDRKGIVGHDESPEVNVGRKSRISTQRNKV